MEPRHTINWMPGDIRFPPETGDHAVSSPDPNTSPNLARLREWAEEEVEETLNQMPARLREPSRRVPVTLENLPAAGLQADGIAIDTLGLFTGAEYTEEGHSPMPPQIMLFLDNLWEYAARDEGRFRKEVRTTLLHELGHYLGLDEMDLTERGLE